MHADAPPAEPGQPPAPALWQALGWQPQPSQLQQLCRLQLLLGSWNQRLNLTRLVDGDDYWISQVFDSLWPLLPLLNDQHEDARHGNAPPEASRQHAAAMTTAGGSASAAAEAGAGAGAGAGKQDSGAGAPDPDATDPDTPDPDGAGCGLERLRPGRLESTETPPSAPSGQPTSAPAFAPAGTGLNVIDVGTGGGFPGLAVAIALPGAQVTLVDSVQRKLDAVAAMATELGLSDRVRVRGERVERTGRHSDCRGRFQLAMARAVAAAPVVAEYLVPLLAPGGQALLYRGQWSSADQQELERALAALQARATDCRQRELPGGRGLRTILRVEPLAACPASYPRAVGVPAKQPLGQAAAASVPAAPRAKTRRPSGRSRG